MATFNGQVGASNDDADDQGSINITGNNINMDAAAAGGEDGGFVWDNVTVPNGATINTATLEPYVRATADDPDIYVWGNDVDSANDFDAESVVGGRTLTTASQAWSASDVTGGGDAFVESPDIASIISEITARGGWSSGNSLCLIGLGEDAGASGFIARSYDFNTSLAAKLNIDYTAGAGDIVVLRRRMEAA